MQIGRIEGHTRIVGKGQGYLGLPLRDEVVNCPVGGPGTPRMVTAWLPTPAEVEAIVAGAAIHVCLYGVAHPPIRLEVGLPPE